MTEAVAVRRDGDAFQARIFWRRAARLLDPASPITRVCFENGPKSYDDVWVEYDPARCPNDHYGHPLLREHIQCKWHVNPDSYGYAQIIDPEFINANARSLLQRAYKAQLNYASEATGVRFKLLTNWRLERSDPLREIVSNRSGAIRVDRLFGSLTDRSKVGAIRKAWREHLGITEDQLRDLAHTLAFGEATDSLDELREHLDALFGLVGLRRIPENESSFPYDDLPFQWMAQGRVEFDRKSFREICSKENLLAAGGAGPQVYGVKSFEHPLDRLQDRCVEVLDFVPEFDERYIRSDSDWANKLYPALRTFLISAASKTDRLRLALDAHVTLAFAAGSILNVKSGRAVELEQRTTSTKLWAVDDGEINLDWATLEFETVEIDPAQPDLAVAVGLTHSVAGDVKNYVEHLEPTIGRILVVRSSKGPSAQSVASGRHAFQLVEALVAKIKAMRDPTREQTVNLFIAAPNAFSFFLGQRQVVIGHVNLFEFDFEGGRDSSYKRSLTLPIPR